MLWCPRRWELTPSRAASTRSWAVSSLGAAHAAGAGGRSRRCGWVPAALPAPPPSCSALLPGPAEYPPTVFVSMEKDEKQKRFISQARDPGAAAAAGLRAHRRQLEGCGRAPLSPHASASFLPDGRHPKQDIDIINKIGGPTALVKVRRQRWATQAAARASGAP